MFSGKYLIEYNCYLYIIKCIEKYYLSSLIPDSEEKAKFILSQISDFSLDENNQLMKCPKCNEEQIEMVTSINDFKSLLTFLFSILIVLIPFYSRYKYKCQSCKFEFS